MQSEDLQVLAQALQWAEAARPFVLVSVLHTWGSSPRTPGAWMVLGADGQVVGSVSGGCIEADLIEWIRARPKLDEACVLKSYGVSREEAARFRLPCGGQLDLVIETRVKHEGLCQLQQALTERICVERVLNLATGEVRLHAAAAHATTHLQGQQFHVVFGPVFRMLLIGASSLSAKVAWLAQALDYQVRVCEPRSEYAASWPWPEVTISSLMPDDAVSAMRPDQRSVILALTHDPKLDDMALIEALKSPAFYVGALGSAANGTKKRERLLQFDLTPEQVAQLHCPVGLALGAHAPEEIALAILAELTALRHGKTVALNAV